MNEYVVSSDTPRRRSAAVPLTGITDEGEGFTIRATPIRVGGRQREDTSRQSDADFFDLAGEFGGTLIPPPEEPLELHTVFQRSNVLRQCVDAYVTNIATFGYRCVPLSEDREPDAKEAELLKSFASKANPTQSMSQVLRLSVFDYEKYGYSFFEIIRNKRGAPTLVKHMPAARVRLMPKDEDEQLVSVSVIRGSGQTTVKERRRFRRYVEQINNSEGSYYTYYKEFGDTRRMSYKTGLYERAGRNGYKVPRGEEATEVIHNKQVSEDAYGLPRWYSQIPNLLGSREAEEVNLKYFQDNTVPPAILAISGGKLTTTSFQTLKELLEQKGVGQERQHQILLLEAIAQSTGLDNNNNVRIDLHKLTDARQSDGLFSAYDDSNQLKITSAFRLPPLLVGRAENANFANAQTSLFFAESQVFAPERKVHDEFFNHNFVNHPHGLHLKTVKLESRGLMITDMAMMVRTLTALNVMGGVTPRTAIEAIKDQIDTDIEQYPAKGEEGYEPWMDKPIQLAIKDIRSANTQAEQSGKPTDVKQLESSGDVANKEPEKEEIGNPDLPNFDSKVASIA